MELPFSTDQFFGVFRDYNLAVWPSQLALNGLAVIALASVFVRGRAAGLIISAILTFLWLWLGVVYHFAFFSNINSLAYLFAVLSVSGAAVFAWYGLFRGELTFSQYDRSRFALGASLVAFALVVYPWLNALAGRGFLETPTFGLPCPTTIFTIGLVCLLDRPYPRIVLLVPVLWSLVGSQAAFLLDVTADLALLPAGIIGIFLMVRSRN